MLKYAAASNKTTQLTVIATTGIPAFPSHKQLDIDLQQLTALAYGIEIRQEVSYCKSDFDQNSFSLFIMNHPMLIMTNNI